MNGGADFYSGIFHASAVSTWHLDGSRARQLYVQLKAQGVTDILAHARTHPDFVPEAMDGLRVVDVNDATLRLFGIADRAQVVGGNVAPFWLPSELSTFMTAIEAAFNNRTEFSAETPMRTFDGRRIDVLFTVTASPESRAAGQTLLSIVDITERVRAQHALVDMQASFAHAARVSSLGELATSIAHEVNQPLAAITTQGEAALRWLDRVAPDLGEVRGLTVRMIADARRASAIIGRIRSMAAPQLAMQRSLSLNTLVHDAMLLMQPELRKRGVNCELALEPDLPDVIGDDVHLQQVLVNLALNAMQAMSETRTPQLCVRTMLDSGGLVRLEMIDNGPGIAEAHLGSLFQSFFTTKPTGMGIGLAICRSIVEAHGGSIDAANGPGGGACLTLLLPARSR
jgi:PAS domain S-box-containing protein